ncbi:hypothetical protein NBRC116188_20180 [Oceaniserpentilla sp. 4NH20-0058]|uniref:class I SAM-dependent methyltransferase n=1 Tax=Oceaniserpentilla sp. 4NH20-0058 TaxID=3127660 RepID=UPI003109A95D
MKIKLFNKNKIIPILLKPSAYLSQYFDFWFLRKDVPTPELVQHTQWENYLFDLAKKNNWRVLEVGSREVTGKSRAREELSDCEYIGFDYYPGENVDVVGDAHKLSTYFDEDNKFDLIFSSACFEHFAMPWLVSQEISKLLKVGGMVFVETHFSNSSHERPWNFFQFSDMGLRVLFSKSMGFECLDSGMSTPIVGRFSKNVLPKQLKFRPVKGLYCHSEYLGRKVEDVPDFSWGNVDLDEIVSNTKYPFKV